MNRTAPLSAGEASSASLGLSLVLATAFISLGAVGFPLSVVWMRYWMAALQLERIVLHYFCVCLGTLGLFFGLIFLILGVGGFALVWGDQPVQRSVDWSTAVKLAR